MLAGADKLSGAYIVDKNQNFSIKKCFTDIACNVNIAFLILLFTQKCDIMVVK